MGRRHLLLLAAAVTDRTFERATLDGEVVWVGRCIHCNTKLTVGHDGRARGAATLEHIWPTAQGGGEELANLAVACARCNREKGTRHDHRRTPRGREVSEALRARRLERWRDPAEVGMAASEIRKLWPADPDGE